MDGYQLDKMVYKGSNCLVFNTDDPTLILKMIHPKRLTAWEKEVRIARRLDASSKTRHLFSMLLASGQQVNPWRKNAAMPIPWLKNSPTILFSVYPRRAVLLDHCTTLPMKDRYAMVIDILRALRHLHQKKIIHRDLHFQNILFDPLTRRFSLVDYDLSLENRQSAYRTDILHFIFSLTNKDLVIRAGGFRNGTELVEHFRRCREWPVLVRHLRRVPLPFDTTRYTDMIRNGGYTPHHREESYHVLLILETLYSALYRRRDCAMRGIPYIPLFVPGPEIIDALEHYDSFPALLARFTRLQRQEALVS